MSPELIAAIKERIDLGHSKEAIRVELHEAGYDDEMVEAAYREAYSLVKPLPIPVPKPEVSTMEPASTNGSSAVLPSATTLFRKGWEFMVSRPDLLFILAIPFAVTAVFAFMLEASPLPNQSLTVALPGIVSLVALVSYLYIWAAAIFTVSKSSERVISRGEAFTWARKNINGLIWINLLAGLVVMGGFLLFIIPGIIISMYVYLAQYVYAKEGVRGIEALLRSRDLVQGNWWALFGRLLLLGLIFFVFFMALGSIVGLAAGFSGDNSIATVILGVAFQLFGAGASLIGLHAGMSLYRALVSVRPASVSTTLIGRGKYVTLAWLGVAFPILMIFLLVTLVSLIQAQKLGQEEVDKQEVGNLEFEVDAKERAVELRSSDQLELPSTTRVDDFSNN